MTAEQQAVADAAARRDGTGAGAGANATGDTNAAAMGAAGLLPVNRPTGARNAAGLLGLNESHSVVANSSVLGGSSRLAAAGTGGPSCRPAELLGLRSGVVNYGC